MVRGWILIHFHFIMKVFTFWAVPEKFYDCSLRSSEILRCNYNWKICLWWYCRGYQNNCHQGDVDHHCWRGVNHRNEDHLLQTSSLGSQFNQSVIFDLGSFWWPCLGFAIFPALRCCFWLSLVCHRKASQIMHVWPQPPCDTADRNFSDDSVSAPGILGLGLAWWGQLWPWRSRFPMPADSLSLSLSLVVFCKLPRQCHRLTVKLVFGPIFFSVFLATF